MHANEALSIKDGNSHSIHFFLACIEGNSCNACFLLEVILTSIEVVLKSMPKNVSIVVEPSTVNGIMATLISHIMSTWHEDF